MNVLVLSAGKRVKIVQYLQRALAGSGRVIVTDCSELAPSLYVADGAHVVPRADSPDYVDTVLKICEREAIGLCLPSIDAELEPLAARAGEFSERGITLMISPLNQVQLAGNKWRMYQFCRAHGIATPRTWVDPVELLRDVGAGEVGFPLFTKPVEGAGSAYIRVVRDAAELDEALAARPGLMVQEFMAGEPLDVDVYIDTVSGEVCGISAKKKLRMRDGTADKSVMIEDPALTAFVLDFCRLTGFRGGLDIDLFTVNGGYSLLEVNPRFGWAYAHSHECGADFIRPMLRNAAGLSNPALGATSAHGPGVEGAVRGNVALSYDEPVMARLGE